MLQLLALGNAKHWTANALGMSYATFERTRKRLEAKLGTCGIDATVCKAFDLDLVEIPFE